MRYLIEKDYKARQQVLRWEWKRLILKVMVKNPYLSKSEMVKRWRYFPLKSSKTRIRNRCILSGRAGSIYTRFRLSRICLREEGNKGKLVGVQRASW